MTAAPPARSSQIIGCDTSPVLTGDEIVVAVVLPDVAGVDAGVFLRTKRQRKQQGYKQKDSFHGLYLINSL
jgi:hypothetical protein